MCILFIAIAQHSDYPLIICANRDEFYQRPTKSAYVWQSEPLILAGQDLSAGGTWLGINQSGDFAALTNLRTGKATIREARSRGELVTKYLTTDQQSFSNWLQASAHEFNPFNLIFGNAQKLECFNSILGSAQTLTAGFHSISNGNMDDIWPKMAKGQQQLAKVVEEGELSHRSKFFSLLFDQSQADDSLLPDTGISYEWEKKLSSIFIQSDGYGTRSSSVLLFHHSGEVIFDELKYDDQGNECGLKSFRLLEGKFKPL